MHLQPPLFPRAQPTGSVLLRALAGLLLIFGLAGILRADDYTPFYGLYGSQSSVSFSITPQTNSAGLPNWNTVTVTMSWSISARNSEGFFNASMSLSGGSYTQSSSGTSVSNIGSGSTWSGYITIVDTSPYQGKTYTASNSLYGWDSGQPNWSVSSSRSSPGVSGSGNTQGNATFSFGGGPWNYDGSSHAITISPSPPQAGWQWSGGNSSGTETNAGSYSMTVTPSNSDFTGSGTYNWSINKGNLTPPTSSTSSATVGSAWSPPFQGPFAAPSGGGYTWCVAGKTNFGDGSWTPAPGDAGQGFDFYVAVYGPQQNFNGSPDSHLPGMVLVTSGPYRVNVANRAPVPALSGSTALKVNEQGSWTFSASDPDGNLQFWRFYASTNPGAGLSPASGYSVGPGTYSTSFSAVGTYTWLVEAKDPYLSATTSLNVVVSKGDQASVTCSANPTTITTAQTSSLSASGGTGSGGFVYRVVSGPGSISGSTMTPTGTGTVFVQAMRQGDANYNDSAWSGSVGITVNPASIATSFTIGNTNQTYDGSPKSVSVTANPSNASYTVTYNGSSSPPTNAGTYSVQVNGTGLYVGSASGTLTINKANQGTVSISPSSQTTSTGNSITFSASGGSGSGAYSWSGDASGSGSSNTVPFNTPGTRFVYVSKNGDSNYNSSNTATATITVNTSTTFSFSPTSFTFDGAAHGPSITANPSNATYSVSGTSSATAAGSYSFTVTATGSFSGSAVCNWTILTPGNLSYAGTTSFGSAYRDAQAGSPTYTTQSFTLTNTGQASLTINTIAMSGNFALASGPGLPFTLSGGASTTITIRFTPGATTGSNTGTCTVNTTANSPVLNLSGTGLAPRVNVNWR